MTRRSKTAPSSFAVPQLETKSLPAQRRSRDTFEVILLTAGELLAEVGFERLTTNLVCERAGVTPPALYRYFPNKYALLTELARRLIDALDEVFYDWMAEGGCVSSTMGEAVAKVTSLHKRSIAATRMQPGGAWILRAIRAVPVLIELRKTSRDKAVERLMRVFKAVYSELDEARLRTVVRVTEQMGYATTELLIENPDMDEEEAIRETAWMTCLYCYQLSERDRTVLAPMRVGAARRSPYPQILEQPLWSKG
jgi:AcrR family transcriptional regulator